MDKLTAIKIKYDDGTYSDEIPVSVLSENVEWDNTHTLVDVLGSIDVDVTGTIQDQISQLFNEKVSNSDMQNYIVNSMPTYITSWLNTNVNPVGSAVVVDSSLSISGAAADAKVIGNELDNITEKSQIIINEKQTVTKVEGYYYFNGAFVNTSYFYVHLSNLEEGDIVTTEYGSTIQPIRFVDAYSGNTRNANASHSGSDLNSYTIPAGVDNVYVSCYIRYVSGQDFYVQRTTTIRQVKGLSDLQDSLDDVEGRLETLEDSTVERIDTLSAVVAEISETTTETTTTNTPQAVTKNSGYYFWNGGASANANYYYVHITDLLPGDIITVAVGSSIQQMRFIDAFSGNARVAEESSNSYVTSYTIHSPVDNVYISCEVKFVNKSVFYVQRTTTVTESIPKGFDELDSRITALENAEVYTGQDYISTEIDTLPADTNLVCAERIDNKKNCSYIFWGKFSTFGSLTIAHGYTVYAGSYVVIDDTKLTAYYYNGSSAQVMGTYTHGLSISDFIQVNIKVANANNLRATVSIMTASGQFSQSNVPFGGCNGSIFAKTSAQMTDVKMQYVLNDVGSGLFLFGDSYTSLGDPNRYPHQLMAQGYTKILISGYSGATS